MSEAVIQTNGLTRYFGSHCAVDQVNFAVPRGSVFALLGRNGSGKTTIVRMLLGLLKSTRGSATILNEDCQRISPATRGQIGYVAEGHPLFDSMRVSELEQFQRSFYPAWEGGLFKKVIRQFDLTGRERAGRVSRGQRAGVSLALVLATKPSLLVMDDPAMGLDPVARRTLLEVMILVTRDAGHTIFFTSHQLDDVERVADHIAILDRSVLRVCCPVESLQTRVKRLSLEFAGDTPLRLEVPGLVESRRYGNEVQLIVANSNDQTDRAVAAMGAVAVRESPLTLSEIAIAYLSGGGGGVAEARRPSLLETSAGGKP